jgi:hypothetical protein
MTVRAPKNISQLLAHQMFNLLGQWFRGVFYHQRRNTQMPKIVDDSLLQAQLLEEAQKLYEKLARLKASLCAADALCDQRINTAADREIEQYRAQRLAAHDGRDDTRAPMLTFDN